MKTIQRPTRKDSKVAALTARLAEAEATLEAIRNGHVDALVVTGKQGNQVFTLKSAEKPYRLLIEAMNEGALTVLPDGTILYCNQRFAEMAQTPIKKIIGGCLHDFIEKRQRAVLQKLLHRVLPGGAKTEFTLQPGNPSVPGFPAQFSLRPLEVDGISAVAVVATDLSSLKRYEEALRRQNQELELRVAERTADLSQANEALKAAQRRLSLDAMELEEEVASRTTELQATINSLEQFCYTIAHDLRAPLRTMHGFSSALLEDFAPRLDEVGRDYARRIVAAATRMDEQIRALLAYGRLNSTQMPLVRTDPRPMLEQITQADEFKQAKIRVEPALPTVLANPTALRQVMDNLLANAVKFVRPGTIPEVRVSARQTGDTVRFLIEDNGIGIDPKYHERIFNVFERIGGSSYPGTGIGLALVQKGVERMGGRVGLESESGKGSRFWIELRKAD